MHAANRACGCVTGHSSDQQAARLTPEAHDALIGLLLATILRTCSCAQPRLCAAHAAVQKLSQRGFDQAARQVVS